MDQLLQKSSIHGVGHILGATSKIWKYFWFLLLFCGVIGITINIVFVLMKYFSHPILLSYSLDYEPFEWPEITICNPADPFMFHKNSFQLEHWRNVTRHTSETSDLIKTKFHKRSVAMSTIDMGVMMNGLRLLNFTRIFHLPDRSGFEVVSDYKPFYYLDTSKYYNQIFSTQIVDIGDNVPCHTFHIWKNEHLLSINSKALYFYINFNYKSYEIFNSSHVPRSVFIYISNKNQIPSENAFVLYPGTETTLTLSQTRYHYNQQKRGCRQNNFTVELYDAQFQRTRLLEGGFDDCRKVASQLIFVKNCHCYSPLLPIFKNETGFPRLCLNATLFSKEEIMKNIKCMYREFAKQFGNFLNKKTTVLDKCQQYKAMKCDSLSYKVDKSTNIFNEVWSKKVNKHREQKIKKYADFLNRNVNESGYFDFLRDEIIEVTLVRERVFGNFYKEENEYPFSEVLSDIGGLMGLWLGMSVVGLFEIAEMFYRYILDVIRKTKKRNDDHEDP